MNKLDNLHSGAFSTMPTEKHKKASSLGGKNSACNRRSRKTIKDCLQKLLSDKIDTRELNHLTINSSAETLVPIAVALSIALINRGVKTGDPRAIELINKITEPNNETKSESKEEPGRISSYEEALRKVLGDKY